MNNPRAYMYLIITSIETDLRRFVKTILYPEIEEKDFFTKDQMQKFKSRAQKEGVEVNDIFVLVDFMDYAEGFELINKFSMFLPEQIIDSIKKVHETIEKSMSVRNRVMHSRPLMDGDFHCIDTLAKHYSAVPKYWQSVHSTYMSIKKNPELLLNAPMAISDVYESSNVLHNLPLADFDDTGFIGREKELTDILRLLKGPDRIISVIGEGGIGKSALMLKAAYELLDDKDTTFEAILWISTKSSYFTNSGIKKIANAIRDLDGTILGINKICTEMAGDICDGITGLLEFFEVSNTLLILDNVENVIDDVYIGFLEKIKDSVKIAITSRIGLGKMDMPRRLSGLDRHSAVKLVKELARTRNCTTFLRVNENKLREIVVQLDLNPLAIKWLVSYVATGGSLETALSNKKDLLNYCMSDVYDKLSKTEQYLLQVLRAMREPSSEELLCYFSALDPIEVRSALTKLVNSSFVKSSIGSELTTDFELGSFAAQYLVTKIIVSSELVKTVAKKKREIVAARDETKVNETSNIFIIHNIRTTRDSQIVSAKLLRDALRLSKRQEWEKALDKIKEAKRIDSRYSEIYCVEGFIKGFCNDLMGSIDSYEIGLEIYPQCKRINYFFAGLLINEFGEYDRPIKMLEAINKDASNSDVQLMLSRAYAYGGNLKRGIEIIDLVLKNASADIKTKKISLTLKMTFMRRITERLIRDHKDYKKAFSHLNEALEVFDQAFSMCLVDDKMRDVLVSILLEMKNVFFRDHSFEKNFQAALNKYEAQWRLSKNSNKLSDGRPEELLCKKLDVGGARVGMIEKYLVEKKFGFITCNSGDRLFFHRKEFESNNEPVVGSKVEFSLGSNNEGVCAIAVRLKD